ncbi:MAG TPA: hydroxyethylthiazole kinase, partial [Clostridiaceae bacterium]|nr:hydroxyethylthiazole kinase [Clostridiaceae bacterium]
AAVALMGLAGEMAREQLTPAEGNVSYRNHIIDQIFLMTPKIFGEKVRYEIR